MATPFSRLYASITGSPVHARAYRIPIPGETEIVSAIPLEGDHLRPFPPEKMPRSEARALLGAGKAHGYHWAVLCGNLPFRCGYVMVPIGHPWYGKDYYQIEASVHRGLTYAGFAKTGRSVGKDPQWWIGFDCAKPGDGLDPALDHLLPYDSPYRLPTGSGWHSSPGSVIRSQGYVETCCIDLCLQARDAALKKSSVKRREYKHLEIPTPPYEFQPPVKPSASADHNDFARDFAKGILPPEMYRAFLEWRKRGRPSSGFSHYVPATHTVYAKGTGL